MWWELQPETAQCKSTIYRKPAVCQELQSIKDVLKTYTAPLPKYQSMEYRRHSDEVPHILDLEIRFETNGKL